jgi:hypothetical protein
MDARKPHLRGIRKLFIEPVTAVIAAKIADKTKLPHGPLGQILQQFDAPTLSYIALEAVIPLLGKQWKRDNPQTIPLAIKQDIGELFYGNAHLHAAAREARKRSATKETKQLARWRRRMMDGKVGLERKQTLKERSARLRKARRSIWWHAIKDVPRKDVIKAGARLYDCVLESEVVYFTGEQLLANPKYGDEIRRLQRIVVRAGLLPLESEPADWTGPTVYRNGIKRQFVNNPQILKRVERWFRSEQFKDRHLRAVHTLGCVPLRIDGEALDLVRRFAPDIKEYPADDDRRNADLLRIVHETETAARLIRRGVFFNTYGVCFRGRMVPEQTFNFQLGDRVRSLFRFAKPVHLSSEGLRWLMIHTANCYGEDKLSYDARVAWVDKNYSDFIVPIAESPEQHFDAWRGCDKPFAFVSACRELLDAERKHETTLPCAFDHTASGLQHLALIGLDEKTAEMVNLTPRDAPSDIYGKLASHAVRLFDKSEAAHYWRELFKTTSARKLLKQPGLSFSYAATLDGNVDQVQEAFYELFNHDPEFEHVLYLVKHFRRACAKKLKRPAKTMEYLQLLVSECTKAKRFLEWPTTGGLLVGNDYTKFKSTTIYCPGGSEHLINEAIPGTIDGQQARNSIAANFVHSLDAAHLVQTVNALALNEMPALCVHDCFAVYASHAGQFHITNREELASMYADLHERGGPLELLRAHNGLTCKPPKLGNFNIWKNVPQAQYTCS